jgi:hypothetical protein
MSKAIFSRLFIVLLSIGFIDTGLFFVGYATLKAQESEKNASDNNPVMPSVPKISTFAPAQDLVDQVQNYIKEMETTLQSEQEYKDSEGKIGRCASTLTVIAQCLGMHDQDNKYKVHAAALIKASQELAASTDYQSAKKALEKVKTAAEGKIPASAELKWEKIAPLPDLMKQVPNINTKLKRYVKGAKFKTKAKDTAGYTAAIAAIAQGSMADTSKAKNTEEMKQWYKFSTDMRDAAGAANAAIHAGDEPAAAVAMKILAQSCDDCHTVFNPSAILTDETNSEKE